MKKRIRMLGCLAAFFTLTPLAAHASDAPAAPLTTIPTLDTARYLGTWYEIAKFPNWFQRDCVGDTSADYSPKAEGQLQVVNRCRMAKGEFNVAVGAARQVGDATSPKFQVRFAPAWLSFLPMVWGNYWIIDLDPDYRLVAVSEPKREYLWILARTKKVDEKRYAELLQRLRDQGFDTRKLETTPQVE